MVEGVENLKYSDVETKITIDKTTGKIDEILMDFQASMQYQGYDADMLVQELMNHLPKM